MGLVISCAGYRPLLALPTMHTLEGGRIPLTNQEACSNALTTLRSLHCQRLPRQRKQSRLWFAHLQVSEASLLPGCPLRARSYKE